MGCNFPRCQDRHRSAIFAENLERAEGFEPSTPTLARLCSTPELRPLERSRPWRWAPLAGVRRSISDGSAGLQELNDVFRIFWQIWAPCARKASSQTPPMAQIGACRGRPQHGFHPKGP